MAAICPLTLKFQDLNNFYNNNIPPSLQNFPVSRKLLHQRHRLSHQQIDDLLQEKNPQGILSEKFEQLLQIREFIRLTDEFREAGISFTPLKGPILSHRLHEDASHRFSNDLDFLIPLNSIKKAISILKKNGYQPHFFPWPEDPKKERRLTRLSNQILFVHPEKQVNIEIHWKLFKSAITNSKVLAKLVELNRDEIVFQKRQFQIFNNEFELLYLVIHGGLHAWFRLKWLVDVKDYLEKFPIDTEKFTRLVHQCNASRMVALCNATLSIYFPDCPLLPCKLIPKTEKRLNFTLTQIKNEEYYNKSFAERVKTYWFEIKCFPGFRFKLSILGIISYGKYLKVFEFQPSA